MATVNRTRLTGLSLFFTAGINVKPVRKRKRLRNTLYVGLILVFFATLTYMAVRKGVFLFSEKSRISNDILTISDLWQLGNYAEVAAIAEKELKEHPLDKDALLYAGFSHFHLAIARLSAEERNLDLNSSIAYLRLLKAIGGMDDNPAQVDYVLGKAYLLKGTYWADLALKYLRASFDSGYRSDDSLEFIGRAYSMLDDVENALFWYELAAETDPTDRLLITLGDEAFKLGRYESAAEYYKRSIDITKDEELRSKGLSHLGQLYYDVGNFPMAKEVFETLVSIEPNNQNYQFVLGETYHQLGMSNEARNAWLAVFRINPKHVGALHRLYD